MAEHPLLLAQVPAPPAPQAVIIDVKPGQVIDLPAPPPDAALAIDSQDVLIARPEAPPIVLRNLVDLAEADPTPIVQLADAAIPAPELISRLAPVDAVRVDTLLANLAASDAPPAPRLAPLPDILQSLVSLADPSADPLALRGEDRPAIQLPPLRASVAVPPEPNPATLRDTPLLVSSAPAETGDDTVLGTAGDDRVAIDGGVSFVDLGPGTDTLDLSAAPSLDLGTRDYNGVEKIDLRGGAANVLTLNAADVLDLSPSTDTLLVRGEANDRVDIADSWTPSGTQINPQGETATFNVYTQNVGSATATLLVENTVPTT